MLPFTDRLGARDSKPPRWYWIFIVFVFISLMAYSSISDGDERVPVATQSSDLNVRLVRALEGIEKASARQARALEAMQKDLKKMKGCGCK